MLFRSVIAILIHVPRLGPIRLENLSTRSFESTIVWSSPFHLYLHPTFVSLSCSLHELIFTPSLTFTQVSDPFSSSRRAGRIYLVSRPCFSFRIILQLTLLHGTHIGNLSLYEALVSPALFVLSTPFHSFQSSIVSILSHSV